MLDVHVKWILQSWAETAKLPFSGGRTVGKNKQPQSISLAKWERIVHWNVCRGLWDLRGFALLSDMNFVHPHNNCGPGG